MGIRHLHKVTPLRIEWNDWNGFIFELLGLEIPAIEGALFGVGIGRGWIVIEVFYYKFTYSWLR